MSEWNSWSSACGKVSRDRSPVIVQSSVEQLSCDNVTNTCQLSREEESKEVNCKFVDINKYYSDVHFKILSNPVEGDDCVFLDVKKVRRIPV